MKDNCVIRKVTALLLIAVFLLANTPTRFLHFLFSDHTDFKRFDNNNDQRNNSQLNTTGYNCHCNSQVVIAPYHLGNTVLFSRPASIYFSYQECSTLNRASIFHRESLLRGPPAIS